MGSCGVKDDFDEIEPYDGLNKRNDKSFGGY